MSRPTLDELLADPNPSAAAARSIMPPSRRHATNAATRIEALATPPGAVSALGDVAVRLAASTRANTVVVDPAEVIVFAGDHGVVASGVTGWPSSITAAMVGQFCAGTATINTIARAAGATVVVVDVGVAGPTPPAPGLIDASIRRGTADLAHGPAMTRDEARAAVDAGARVALERIRAGAACLCMGDMGIGNTTPAAAMISALLHTDDPGLVGRGTGIDDHTLEVKRRVVKTALGRLAPDAGPLDVTAEVGGLEHAALAGLVLAGAATGTPVIADGVIALAGVLLAEALAPGASAHVIAGHRSPEPAATAVLDALDLRPLLELDLRLGEGSGAALALPLVRAAVALLTDVSTVAEVLATIDPVAAE